VRGIWAAAALAVAWTGAARAEVADKSAAGFEVVETATIAAPAGKVWAALMRPSTWWDSRHTFTGAAKNLYIDPAGCFCEQLPKGAVRHMTIVYADGRSLLRLAGALGPLQATGATGSLTFALKPDGTATDLTLTYDVGGYARGGLAQTWAAPVDQVLGAQLGRLKKAVETGKPD